MMNGLRLENEEKLKAKELELEDEQNCLQSEMQSMRFEFEKKLHDEKLRYENELNRQLSTNTELEDCKQVPFLNRDQASHIIYISISENLFVSSQKFKKNEGNSIETTS